MDNIEEQIWNYGFLEPDAQMAVDRFVLRNPEYADILEGAKMIYSLAADLRLSQAEVPDDAALAYLVAHERSLPEEAPPQIKAAFEALREQVSSNPLVNERYLELKQRMERLAGTADPIHQFESLTEHDVTAIKSGGQRRKPDAKGFGSVVDRPPVVRETGQKLSKRIAYGALVLSLFVLSMFYGNRNERRAYLDPVSFYEQAMSDHRGHPSLLAMNDWENVTVEELLQSDLDRRFAGGLHFFFQAQHVRLGIYHYYEREKLEDAEAVLSSLLHDPNLSIKLKDEVKYVLARVLVAKNESELAATLLQEVENAGGIWANAAGELRARL